MRLFVAIHFSPAVKSVLLDAIEDLRFRSKSGNFTRPENLHLTLAFIGETDNLDAAKDAVSACDMSAFSIAVEGAGRFGDLYWAGIAKNTELSRLAAVVQNELRNRGFDIERRPFKPHITLARQLKSDAPVNVGVPRTGMAVRRISLMKSERINGKLTYTEVFGRDMK